MKYARRCEQIKRKGVVPLDRKQEPMNDPNDCCPTCLPGPRALANGGDRQGMVIAAWTLKMAFPELFSSEATALLLLLTLLQLAATLPLLKKAVLTVLGACWWRPSAGSRISRVPGRRRQ